MKVGIDIAEYAGNNFLILVDYLSKWLEKEMLKNKTSAECISKIKKVFSTHGIPEIVIADNMPFDSYECKQFSKEWNFTFRTSSPNYPKSNGQSEKAVGTIKDMLKKCKNEGIVDFELFKLNYNNSPGGLNFSPAQILMIRRLRTKLPYKMEDLKPKVLYNEAYKLIMKGKDKLTKYYNKTSLNNNTEFMTGEKVWIQDVKSKFWSEGSITLKTLPLRSYLVKMDKNNRVINDIFIKKVKTFQRLDKRMKLKKHTMKRTRK